MDLVRKTRACAKAGNPIVLKEDCILDVREKTYFKKKDKKEFCKAFYKSREQIKGI